MDRRAVLAALAALLPASLAGAHGGGLDSSGGHNNRKTGGYHYHRKVSTPAPKPKPAPAVPKTRPATVLATPQPAPPASPGSRPDFLSAFSDLTAHDKLDALARALIRKDVISESDLEFAARNLLP